MTIFLLSFGVAIAIISVVVASSAQESANDSIYFEGNLDGKANKFVHKKDSNCSDCRGVWYIFEDGTYVRPTGTNLTIETTSFVSIPEDLFISFPELVSLQQSYQNIILLKSWNFENAKELRFLNLSNNEIAEIEGNLFIDTSNLQIIDLSHNRISIVPTDIPISVMELYLHNNLLTKIVIDVIPRGVQLLTLNDNDLMELDGNGIFDDLQYFDISNNVRLQETHFVGADSKFFGASNISSVFLSISRNADVVKADYNKISRIEFYVDKAGFCNVQELHLAHNSIEYFYMFNEIQFPLLKILDLSYNLIKYLSDSTFLFIKMPSLQKLNLSYNTLFTFDTAFLAEMINLKVLDVSHTKLSSFDLNKTVTQVEELFIDGNELKHLEMDIFDKTVNLKKINLNKNSFSRRDKKKFASLLSSKNITMLNDEVNDQSVSGHFIMGFTDDNDPMRCIYLKTKLACDDCEPFYEDVWFNVDNPYKNFQVRSLTITESSSPVIQRDLFFAFPNVKNLQMSHQGIVKLSDENFENANHLHSLNLSYNALTEVNFEDFRLAAALTIIDLSYNKIRTIQYYNNEYLNLIEVFLHGNHLVKFDSEWVSSKLKVLTLNDNMLREVNWKLFTDKYRDLFNRIDLSNNPELTSSDAINYCSKLIDISNTNSSKLFINPKIEFIKAEYSNIFEFEFEVIYGYDLHHLRELLLAHNSISSISAFKSHSMYDLKVLDLSYNLLEVLDTNDLNEIYNLEKVNLSHNRLHKIIPQLFSPREISFIDLSFNALAEFDIISDSLQYLNVEGNRLKELNINNIRSNNLKRIGLNGNNWNCQYLNLLITSLQAVGVLPVSTFNASLLSATLSKYDTHFYGIGCWNTL